MYTRILNKPETSILLFGPRGTGKSTWIQQHFPDVRSYDLLDSHEAMRLSKDPSVIFDELNNLPPDSWVVIDEVQKVPALLDEVHRLIEKHKLKFVLSGSSARKLKRGAANLLAGRAITTDLFPLVSSEVNFSLRFPDFFTLGMLPLAYTGANPVDFLMSYVHTYLQEEIKAEALTRNIGAFARFLEIAARQNAQITNCSNIARDALVERMTVENYFQILVDTLMGMWLPAWKLKRSNQPVSHPKFYFFDSGVARALSGRLPYPPTREELGGLVETSMLNEIRAYISYNKLHYELFFWRNSSETEVDVLLETKGGYVAIEIKAGERWNSKFNTGFRALREKLKRSQVNCFGVFQGPRVLSFDGIQVFPVVDFLKKLWTGEIIR